jgi:inosine-uridine nucleoside N-ribohydrolase
VISRRAVFALLSPGVAAGASAHPLVIDTDCGTDDLIAIAFLLSRKDVRIEAIVTVNGLAHACKGAENILRLLELAGRTAIPVYAGRSKPEVGGAEFPSEWRRESDELTGVPLPAAARRPESEDGVDFLIRRFSSGPPVRVLALGPLTNIAAALARAPSAARRVEEIAIMGGAIAVPGNIGDGGFFKSENKTAEWNLFADPRAAQRVFTSAMKLRLVPLDATNRVPIDAHFVRDFDALPLTPLGRFVSAIFGLAQTSISGGYYFAWDPLAAAVIVDPRAAKFRPLSIDVRIAAPEEGRTVPVPGAYPNAEVAVSADPARFRRLFFAAFAQPIPKSSTASSGVPHFRQISAEQSPQTSGSAAVSRHAGQ